jgi:hypothetical protein
MNGSSPAAAQRPKATSIEGMRRAESGHDRANAANGCPDAVLVSKSGAESPS